MNQTVNGKTRKTLASQLDRLDSILDGLSEGLNGAVADAVREATGAAVEQAVHKALLEVLTNPDVLALLAGAAPPRQPASARADRAERSGLRGRLATAEAWAAGRARAARTVCHRALGGVKAGLLGLWRLATGPSCHGEDRLSSRPLTTPKSVDRTPRPRRPE